MRYVLIFIVSFIVMSTICFSININNDEDKEEYKYTILNIKDDQNDEEERLLKSVLREEKENDCKINTLKYALKSSSILFGFALGCVIISNNDTENGFQILWKASPALIGMGIGWLGGESGSSFMDKYIYRKT